MENSNNRYTDFVNRYPYDTMGWDGKITVCFSYAIAGWIQLWISGTSYLQHITLYTSHVFNPYPALIEWLEAVAENRLPARLAIDEEGVGKTLIALPLDDGRIDMQIQDALYEEDGEILFRMRVDRRQLVAEFVRKFELFLKDYYDKNQWEFGHDLPMLDLSRLNQYIQPIK